MYIYILYYIYYYIDFILYSLKRCFYLFILATARVLTGMERRERVIKTLNSAASPVNIYSILLTPALVMTSKRYHKLSHLKGRLHSSCQPTVHNYERETTGSNKLLTSSCRTSEDFQPHIHSPRLPSTNSIRPFI